MNKFFYLSVFASMMFAGCQNELIVNETPVADNDLKIITRTTDMSELSSNQWTDGDKLGMILSSDDSQENINLTYNWLSNGWTLDADTPLDKTKLKDGMDIFAVTPFDGTSFNSISFSLPTDEGVNINDQSTPELHQKCQLLVAESTLSLYSDAVSLKFKHKLAKLVLKFDYQYQGFFVEKLPQNVILYDMPKSYTLADGVWTASEDKLISIKPYIQDARTMVAYVIPHTIKANNEFISLLVTIKNDKNQETTRTHRISLNEDLELVSGKEHIINVTIK